MQKGVINSPGLSEGAGFSSGGGINAFSRSACLFSVAAACLACKTKRIIHLSLERQETWGKVTHSQLLR